MSSSSEWQWCNSDGAFNWWRQDQGHWERFGIRGPSCQDESVKDRKRRKFAHVPPGYRGGDQAGQGACIFYKAGVVRAIIDLFEWPALSANKPR